MRRGKPPATDVAGDLVVVDQPFVQARGLALTKAGADQVKIIGVGDTERRYVPDHMDSRQGNAILSLDRSPLHARACWCKIVDVDSPCIHAGFVALSHVRARCCISA